MSVAAHELRTPVTGIKAGAQLGLRNLESDNPDLHRATKYMLNILGGANRLVVLINDLMDVSRIRNGHLILDLVPTDFAAMQQSLAALRSDTARHLTSSIK